MSTHEAEARTFYLYHASDPDTPFNQIVADSVSEVRSLLHTFYSDTDSIVIREA